MYITFLTLFPDMFQGPLGYSMMKRASQSGAITWHFVNIRDFADDSYKTVDDKPYGGGRGMILRVDVVDRALRHAKTLSSAKPHIILLDPAGSTFSQRHANSLRRYDHLIFICGHYEGYDERIRTLVDEELSIGDYVLTGGELPAMIVADAVVRLLPGVIGEKGTSEESFTLQDQSDTLLEYPQYTRPAEYNGMAVPEILVSGDHKKIDEWRRSEARKRTHKRRPDLLDMDNGKQIKKPKMDPA